MSIVPKVVFGDGTAAAATVAATVSGAVPVGSIPSCGNRLLRQRSDGRGPSL